MATSASASADGASSIQVAVRVRPFTIQEAAQLAKNDDGPLFLGDGSLAAAPKPKLAQKGLRPVIKVIDDKCLIFDPPEDNPVQRFSRAVMPTGKRVKDQTFGFDKVFDENATQADVYEATTRNLLDSVMDGYNATVFAYGATGCGKTHTITGTSSHPGIIFMTMQELFEKVEEVRETKESEITLSYLEIYNETIRDLLSPDTTGKQSLMLREDNQQTVSVAGLTSLKPQNVQEVMDMVIQGNAARTQSPTEANATSSRSHAVLQVNVSLKDRDASVHEPVTFATLSIIDLAGSERASATKNRGARLQEGANINKSLLALGSCINALCDNRKSQHIPYRNSKLTRLLKFSLGGNCRTVMIVCISPSSVHYDETQNTLRYANRAKNIQTKSIRNVFNVDRHVKDYLKKIDEQMAYINELKAMQNDHEQVAFAKFRKAESKRGETLHVAVQRLRAAFDHSMDERKDRITANLRLKQIERRIGMISAWVGTFDTVCESREDEEPPASLTAFRKTAQGILVELEGSRQHHHQRLARNNWTRALETALADGIRQLQSLDGAVTDSIEEANLRLELENLRSRADLEMYMAVLDQEKGGETGSMQVLLSAHFETVAILNQILQMTQEEAVQAARETLGKVMQSCAESTGQMIRPDGGLQITEAVPPTRAGTPRKKKQISLMGPSPLKTKVRQSTSGVLAMPALPMHMAAEMQPSPLAGSSPVRGVMGSPKRRVKLGGMARKGVAFSGGTPKRRSPQKKRVVRWKDEDTDDGTLVEYQPTPRIATGSPTDADDSTAGLQEVPQLSGAFESLDLKGDLSSSPVPPAPIPNTDTYRPGAGRFATGFLSKKSDSPTTMPPPSFSVGLLSSDEGSSPLREMAGNRAPRPATKRTDSAINAENTNSDSAASGSDAERSLSDREAAQEIGSAMRRGKRSSSLGSNAAVRTRPRESAYRRRSPTASSPPCEPSSISNAHARRLVSGHRSDSHRNSILSPHSAPIGKGTAPVSQRRSMFDLGATARDQTGVASRAPVRVSSIVPGSATRPGSSSGTRAVWR